MAAIHTDNAQINKRTAVALHHAENFAQPRGIAEIRIRVGEGQVFDLRDALHHEGIKGAVLAADDSLNARSDFFVIDGAEPVQTKHPQSSQRRKRHEQQRYQQTAVYGPVASVGCRHGGRH